MLGCTCFCTAGTKGRSVNPMHLPPEQTRAGLGQDVLSLGWTCEAQKSKNINVADLMTAFRDTNTEMADKFCFKFCPNRLI